MSKFSPKKIGLLFFVTVFLFSACTKTGQHPVDAETLEGKKPPVVSSFKVEIQNHTLKVDVFGQNFHTEAQVEIKKENCDNVQVHSALALSCTLPTLIDFALKDIIVVNPDGFRNTPLVGNSPPTITSISPITGSVNGGSAITLTGTGFIDGAIVYLNDSVCTSPSVLSSTSMTCLTPSHPQGAASAYVMNPDSQSGSLANAFTFTPGNSWRSLTISANTPAARRLARSVWTGTKMIVWGGEGGGLLLMNTGGIYDPATDSWSPTSTGANVPNPRRFHQAVWTGTQMIIWGGEGGGYLSTGGMYSPVTNSWTATSVGANMPSPRIHHTAVWTGNRMIIWGGRDNLSVPTGSGGIFDPTNNTWLPTAMVMGPTPRQYHTAIWTGSHMVVWGGDNGSTDTHTGMRLEPTTLTWSSISVGPSPRTRHTAVWTGSKMIIWGGYASLVSTFISTGGIWDSATDTWLPTSLIGAPPATQLALGFWTGSKMLIWSGDPATTNIGGLYDPVSHTWSATSLGANVPSPRWGATGVWTGSEMLIWGGMTSTGETNSGSRYTP